MAHLIRAAVHGDIDAMRAVEVDAGARFAEVGLGSIAEDEPMSADDLAAYVDGRRAWVIVEGEDGPVVGSVVVSIVDGHGHVDQIDVARSAQGRGLGVALMAVAEAWASAAGCTEMTLTTFRDVEFNGPWYRRRGYHDLEPDQLGPELAAIRAAEVAAGLDVEPRVAMARTLD